MNHPHIPSVPFLRQVFALALCALCASCGGEARSGAQRDATDTGDEVESADADMAEVTVLDAVVDIPDGEVSSDVVEPVDLTTGPVLYPVGRRHSPMTIDVVANLRTIAANGLDMNDQVFAKVGDAMTSSGFFLHCFAGERVMFGGAEQLALTRDWFILGAADDVAPFERVSLAAAAGWRAGDVFEGDPDPLAEELSAIAPRFAVVMFGTRDVGDNEPDTFGGDMLTLVDRLMERGVVPILSSIPPRDDNDEINARVPLFNALIRGVAQSRQVPFVDLYAELAALGDHGLAPGGVYLNARDGGCDLSPAGLAYGYNVRNLVTLEALDRARSTTLGEQEWLDANAPTVSGDGTPESPIEIPSLPFTDVRNTASDGRNVIGEYTGCSASQNESGHELYYRLVLAEETRIKAWVVDRGSVDIDVHLLDESASAEGCLQRDHHVVTATLPAGTYHFALDTWVNDAGDVLAGEYLFVVVREPGG